MIQRRLEPHWLPFYCVNVRHLPLLFRQALLNPGSTTRRIVVDEKKTFDIHVLKEGWGRITHSEAKALKIRTNTLSFIRETEIYCDQKLWMYARCVFPFKSLKGKNSRLRKLGSVPLGRLLFSDPMLVRSKFEFARLNSGNDLYWKSIRSLPCHPKQLWARRSAFWLQKKPLLLTEVFL